MPMLKLHKVYLFSPCNIFTFLFIFFYSQTMLLAQEQPFSLAHDNTMSSFELDFACLREAYPGFIKGVERDGGGRIFLLTTKGKVLYDDGKVKTHTQELMNGDIEDSMKNIYPLEPKRPALGPSEESGRVRSYALLSALYGENKQEVEKKLVPIKLCGNKLLVTERVHTSLNNIEAEIQQLISQQPALKIYFSPMDGAFYWRSIAGTDRLSAHSYGIAIDLNAKQATYWRWSKQRPHPLQNSFSPALVALFEKHGFIWGGKWNHYDLMHFEYRPEILIKSHYLDARQTGQQDSH